MPEETVVQPVAPQPAVEQKPVVESPKQEDLISRVSKFQVENEKVIQPTEQEVEFDYKNIEKITDPVAKEQALEAYKSFQRGFNKKFQELAGLRKEFETTINSAKEWTPDKVQSLLNDPKFVQAAQAVAGNSTIEDEMSNLSEAEKAKIQQLEKELSSFKQQQLEAQKVNQDAELKSRYVNYDPKTIDGLVSDMMSGRVQATREHLWKVVDYENAVKRAYELGKRDSQEINKEKLSSLSTEGVNVSNNEPIEIKPGEKPENIWRRIVAKNLASAGSQQLRK